MVVFVDFEQNGDDNLHHHAADDRKFDFNVRREASTSLDEQDQDMETALKPGDERTNPNLNGFSASLSCYPIIKRIAQSVDLNTLHVLSRTCRQFRANLMPFRSQLIKLTLRCEYEDVQRYVHASTDEIILSRMSRTPQLTSGKIGLCARDMVAECQRCTRPCGRSLANEDTTYNRGWTWRTRYSTYLGGLGTGIGEGCQGVKCGRGEFCLAAQDIEVEIDCSSEEWMANQHDNGHGHGPDYHHGPIHYRAIEGREGRDEEKPGYLSQEIEGVGGVVKRKVKKRLRVGACVQEHEDERETAEYLTREQSGQDRSWCGWCSRIVLGEKDSVENSSNPRRPSPSS
ncbi:hypothetical protein FQN54_000513 [Arachnomyces sp. PD_36]|nr:hypothetical protein FQN54_000513 [Arachnomyces sp. PD_36]